MPPYAQSRCVGDYSIVAPSNPLYGYGDLKTARDVRPNRNVELDATSGTPEIKTSTRPLLIKSADVLTVQATGQHFASGSTFTATGAQNANLIATTGQAHLHAQAGDVRLTASASFYQTAQHRTSDISSSISDTAGGNVSLTATSGTFTATSNGIATLESGSNEVHVYGKSKAHVRADAAHLQSTAGDVTVQSSAAVTLDGVNVNAIATAQASVDAPAVVLGATANTVTISSSGKETSVGGNMTIAGNLTVSGSTTQVSTEQVLVKDNHMVLNSASEVGKDAGLLFRRDGADASSFYWDESAKEFVLATTKSSHDSPEVVHEAYSTLRCKNIIVEDGIQTASSATVTVNVADNAGVDNAVPISGLKHRGSYQFVIESTSVDGATATIFASKSQASQATASVFVVTSSFGAGDQDVYISWPADSTPALYHLTPRTGATSEALEYKVFYSTVG